MTLAADRWPVYAGPGPSESSHLASTLVVWRGECAKLAQQVRVRVAAALCLGTPFLAAAVFHLQSALPQDTLFGQWVHATGLALPLVVLGFSGQWVLPLLTAVVAGDIFSSEDAFGTWKTILTRSRSRGHLFAGKCAAACTYTVAMLVLLAVSSIVAGVVSGSHPLDGLTGQLVSPGRALGLVVASWATQVAPLLAYCALAIFLSVVSRNSAVGMGGPLLVGLVLQLSTLVNLPETVRASLISTAFVSWHGLWTVPAFDGPLRQGLVVSAAWIVAATDISWIVFRARPVEAS